MFERIAACYNLDLTSVPAIGDSLRDLQAAESSGALPMLVLTGKGEKTLADGGLPGRWSSRIWRRRVDDHPLLMPDAPDPFPLFSPVVVLGTIIFGTLVVIGLIFPLHVRFRIIWFYRRGFMWLVRAVLGITHEVRGRENPLPKAPSVILAKHQSAWETVALQDLVPEDTYCVFVLKRNCSGCPSSAGVSPRCNRSRSTVRLAVSRSTRSSRRGRSPQARFLDHHFPKARAWHRADAPLQAGGAYLSMQTGAHVVPVALTPAGMLATQRLHQTPGSRRRQHRSGDRSGRPDAGRDQHRAEAWIEAEMRRLSPHRYRDAAEQPAAA